MFDGKEWHSSIHGDTSSDNASILFEFEFVFFLIVPTFVIVESSFLVFESILRSFDWIDLEFVLTLDDTELIIVVTESIFEDTEFTVWVTESTFLE